MTEDELQAIEARLKSDYPYWGMTGEPASATETLLAEVRRLRRILEDLDHRPDC